MKVLSYPSLIIAAVVGIVLFADDPSSVSIYEWIFLAIQVYSAVSLFRIIYQLYGKENKLSA